MKDFNGNVSSKKKTSTVTDMATWSYGTTGFNVLYLIVTLFFTSAMLVSFRNRPPPDDRVVTMLNFLGFLVLLIYQYCKRWTFGVGAIAALVVVSFILVVRSYDVETKELRD